MRSAYALAIGPSTKIVTKIIKRVDMTIPYERETARVSASGWRRWRRKTPV
jgi:hypothetical protein